MTITHVFLLIFLHKMHLYPRDQKLMKFGISIIGLLSLYRFFRLYNKDYYYYQYSVNRFSIYYEYLL